MQVHTRASRTQQTLTSNYFEIIAALTLLFGRVDKIAFTMALFILRCIESKYSDKY